MKKKLYLTLQNGKTLQGYAFGASGEISGELVFSTGMGADLSKPMALVTIGGLVYGTLLTLLVIPCIYDIFHSDKKKANKEI